MARVTESALIMRAKEIESSLKEEGVEVHLDSYFAYGFYGYFFDFPNSQDVKKQIKVDLATAKECLEQMNKVYYMVLDEKEKYMY